MAGTIVANVLNTDTSGGIYTTNNAYLGMAKAWVNFNGGTAAIRSSFNISSVTRNSAGIWTVNFSIAMANANYAIVLGSSDNTDTGAASIGIYDAAQGGTDPTTSSFRVATAYAYDAAYVCITILGT